MSKTTEILKDIQTFYEREKELSEVYLKYPQLPKSKKAIAKKYEVEDSYVYLLFRNFRTKNKLK